MNLIASPYASQPGSLKSSPTAYQRERIWHGKNGSHTVCDLFVTTLSQSFLLFATYRANSFPGTPATTRVGFRNPARVIKAGLEGCSVQAATGKRIAAGVQQQVNELLDRQPR